MSDNLAVREEKDHKAKGDAGHQTEASHTSAGSSAKSRSDTLASPVSGAPQHGRDGLTKKGEAAFNAAVKRVDASIARAIADAIDAAAD